MLHVAVLDVRLPPGFRDEGLRSATETGKLIPGLPLLVLCWSVSLRVERRWTPRSSPS